MLILYFSISIMKKTERVCLCFQDSMVIMSDFDDIPA